MRLTTSALHAARVQLLPHLLVSGLLRVLDPVVFQLVQVVIVGDSRLFDFLVSFVHS